jgi:hypothetical protein
MQDVTEIRRNLFLYHSDITETEVLSLLAHLSQDCFGEFGYKSMPAPKQMLASRKTELFAVTLLVLPVSYQKKHTM